MSGNTMDHGRCLTEDTLAEYLEGGLDPVIKAASEVHLVACDECRHRLGFFMRLLDEDVTSQEAVDIQAITQQWAQSRPERVMGGRREVRRRWFLTVAAVAAGLVIGIVSVRIGVMRSTEPESAGEVVQLLLSQARPFEPRLSDQPHLPFVRTRGVEDKEVAYGLLAGEMTRLSADSHQMGRFYLLQKDFIRAIAYLEMAEQEVGAAAQVHNDLGVAYLESGGDEYMQKAAVEFRHALDLNATFAPAVFNWAVFYERSGANAEAESQWRKYLELDKNSPWASEAQFRLQRLAH